MEREKKILLKFSLGQFFAKSKLGVKTYHKPVIIQCAIVVEENLHYYQDGQIRLTYRTQTIANFIFTFAASSQSDQLWNWLT